MIDQNQVTRLLEFLSSSQKLFFLFSNTKQADLFLAVLASYLFFNELPSAKKTKLKLKEVAIFCPNKPNQAFSNWPRLENYLKEQKLLTICQRDLGRENLLISFPYQPEQVDRVAYHIGDNNKRFHLTIKPKKGSAPLDHQQVEFSYIGSSADLLMLFGVNDLEDLQDLYFTYQDLYQNTPLITINTFLPDFGTLNLDISGASGYGEAIFYLLKSLANLLDLEMSSLNNIDQLATLLLASISLKTKNFTSSQMTADSFLAVAELLQLGGKRLVEFDNSNDIVARKSTEEKKVTELSAKKSKKTNLKETSPAKKTKTNKK